MTKGNKKVNYYKWVSAIFRYLYRGVVNEKNILSINNDLVTFRYQESKTKAFKTITEEATAFLWRVLQHVLPKGFRRARNYGFLHGNAKHTLKRLQLLLRVVLPPIPILLKKGVCCPNCKAQMTRYLMKIGHRIIVANTI